MTNKGFTGQYTDVLTGLDYYNARSYDPVVGVFLSADTVQGNLQGMNPYAYVGNNPETRTDPTGEMYAPGTGGGEGGPSGKQLQNDANAYTHHTAPSGGYQNSTLPWLLYMFLYNRRAWGSLEGNAENHDSSFLPTLSEQALSYLHFTSDVNWNASSDLQALYAQLVSLSVLHLVQLSGETGLEGAMDLVGVEAAIDRMATEGGGAFTANAEGDNGTGDEEGNGGASEEGNRSASSEECGALSFTPTTTVSTAHGKQAIGTMQVGEQVWAYNPRTKKMELESVLHVWINHDNDLVDLTLTATTWQLIRQ